MRAAASSDAGVNAGICSEDRLFDLLEEKEVQTEDEKGAERVCRVERRDPRFPVEGGSKGRWNCGYGSIGSNFVPGRTASVCGRWIASVWMQ